MNAALMISNTGLEGVLWHSLNNEGMMVKKPIIFGDVP